MHLVGCVRRRVYTAALLGVVKRKKMGKRVRGEMAPLIPRPSVSVPLLFRLRTSREEYRFLNSDTILFL